MGNTFPGKSFQYLVRVPLNWRKPSNLRVMINLGVTCVKENHFSFRWEGCAVGGNLTD